jgi:tetratricopeptide (TPR) repeat protein
MMYEGLVFVAVYITSLGSTKPLEAGNSIKYILAVQRCMTMLAKFHFLLAITTMATFQIAVVIADDRKQDAYSTRGQEVEQRHKKHTSSLKAAFFKLELVVKQERSDLLPKLEDPERRQYGYQLIPAIISDSRGTCADKSTEMQDETYRPKTSRFSWPITDARIEKQMGKLDDVLVSKLASLVAIADADVRHKTIETMVEAYVELRTQNRFLDEMIQHNWLWQSEISVRKAQYEKSTLVHDAIVERMLLLDALSADDDEAYETALQKISSIGPTVRLRSDLLTRVELLDEKISHSSKGLALRDYVQLEQAEPDRWVFWVPVTTDIVNERFLQEFKSAIENRWCFDDGQDQYRVRIDLQKISTAELYQGSAIGDVPRKDHIPIEAEQIDLVAHCRRFPAGAAVLSSGAKKTYNGAGCLFVGPEDVTPSSLVHEFGHLLGFADEYVRGFRDLKQDGYEILEIMSDNENIMASSRGGAIHRYHFDALVAGTHFRAGAVAARSGDNEVAIIAYRKTIEIGGESSNTADAYNNLGWSLKEVGEYEPAIAAFEAAIALRPAWALPKNNMRLVRKILQD